MNAHSNTQLTRRKALFGLGAMVVAAPVVALAAPPAAAHPDAALLAAWDGYRAAWHAFDSAVELLPGGGTEEDHAPYLAAIESCIQQIETLPASTVDGLAVQLRYLFAALLESQDALDAGVYGAPVTAGLAADLKGDDRYRMLWTMAQSATHASSHAFIGGHA